MKDKKILFNKLRKIDMNSFKNIKENYQKIFPDFRTILFKKNYLILTQFQIFRQIIDYPIFTISKDFCQYQLNTKI